MNNYRSLALVFIAPILWGQQSSNPGISFDVASIKPLKNSEGAFHYNVLPNRLDVKNMNLRFLLEDAYDLPDFELSVPDSIGYRHFDITAVTSAAVARADMRIMLKNLLIERFHLMTHWNARTESIYRLEVLPTGPAMTPAVQGYASPNSPVVNSDGSMQLNGPMSMRQLAERMTRFAGRPIIDKTGLDGYFKIVLNFTPESPAAQSDSTAPFLTRAVQQQLGLKLVPVKEPIKILVVDHADEVPTVN